jgi:hypothetical protein
MRIKIFGTILFGTILVAATLTVSGLVAANAQQPGAEQGTGPGGGPGGWRGGMGGFPAGGRGILGSVTEVAADHYTVKTDAGETYTVHFSVNTRILKQGPGGQGTGRGAGRRQAAASQDGQSDGGERSAPQVLKPTDIKVGDFLTAGGEVDTNAKSVGAIFILQLDPDRAKQMRAMQADYGKTWLAGRITAVDGTTITIEGMVDHAPHAIVVDENTSFRKRRDSITLADIQVGEQLRAEGAAKGSTFLATTVTAVEPQNRGQGRDSGPNQAPGAVAPGTSGSQSKPQ